MNLNKNKTESKMENPRNNFREINFSLQLVLESQIKSKIVIGWILRKKKECTFCNVYLTQRKFFNNCFLSRCTVYWINVRIYIYFYISKKHYFIHFCYLFVKSSKYLQGILKSSRNKKMLVNPQGYFSVFFICLSHLLSQKKRKSFSKNKLG